MFEWLNKKVHIKIQNTGKILFFTAKVTNVTEEHISFVDKFNELRTFRISDIVEVQALNNEKVTN